MAVENINGVSSYQAQQSFMMNQNNTGNQVKAVEETGKDAGTSTDSDTMKNATDYAETVQQTIADNNAEMKAQETDLSAMHEKIKKSIADYSSKMGNYEAQFGIHEATNRVTIKLVDKDTKKVIKELPPEKTLDMIAKCMEIAGMLVDQKI